MNKQNKIQAGDTVKVTPQYENYSTEVSLLKGKTLVVSKTTTVDLGNMNAEVIYLVKDNDGLVKNPYLAILFEKQEPDEPDK